MRLRLGIGTKWNEFRLISKYRSPQITEIERLVVARDGIEPPTPAFSGLLSPNLGFGTKQMNLEWQQERVR